MDGIFRADRKALLLVFQYIVGDDMVENQFLVGGRRGGFRFVGDDYEHILRTKDGIFGRDGHDAFEVLVHPQVVVVEQEYFFYHRSVGSRHIDQCDSRVRDKPIIGVVHLYDMPGVGDKFQMSVQAVVRNDRVREVIVGMELLSVSEYNSSADVEYAYLRAA